MFDQQSFPLFAVAAILVGACSQVPENSTTDAGGSSGINPVTHGETDAPEGTTMDAADLDGEAGTSNGADEGSATSDGSDGSSSDTGTNDPGNSLDCGGTTYTCGDGIDNDRDGRIDLDDPECTGPCDDDESSFQTGIPGDNMDCKQDCFFDGNSGQGDDKCEWNLKCDPENPGEFIGCEYTGGNNCDEQTQSDFCIDFCQEYTPPGCDCFGCCTVQTADGEVNVFLNSGPDCSLDNLDACSSCTPSTDCGNDCNPRDCELCFGEDVLPEGCDETVCEGLDPCGTTADCPTDYYCYLGCCYPPPPG